MSKEYVEQQMDKEEGQEYEQYQNEDENLEEENQDNEEQINEEEEKHQVYEIEDNHNDNHQEEEEGQETKHENSSKIKKNESSLYSKNTNKTISKQTSKKTNSKVSENPGNNAPNKTQMKKYKDTVMKAMNYRVDIYKTQEKCVKLEKDIEDRHKKLEKVNKERDSLRDYLNKLEKVMKKKTDTDNNDSTKININKNKNTINTINTYTNTNKSESQYFTEKTEGGSENVNENNKLTISMTGTAPVITMDDGQGNKNIIKSKASLMKFLYKIYIENQNLKNFQEQVFNLSKNYDDINNILAESISGFQDIAKSTKREDIVNEVDTRLKDLKTQVESSMEQKQREYNTQLEKKEEDINMLNKAYDNIYKEIQQKKSDKLHEQKTIENLNSQIEILETKLAYLKQKH